MPSPDFVEQLKPYLEEPKEPWEIARCGEYSLVRVLGVGGMATVFLGIRGTAQRAAVKIPHPEVVLKSGKGLARFGREIATLANIKSPYVVSLQDHSQTRAVHGISLPWFAMDYIKGRTLAGKLTAWGRLPQVQVARLGKQICLGLSHVHAKKVLHRDIKPSNVLLDIVHAEQAMLADFGVSRLPRKKAPKITVDGLVGTFGYLAPEVWDGKSTSHRSDLFSVGCVLYEALTGRPAFTPTEFASTRETPVHPCDIEPQLNRGIVNAVMRLLARDPEQRIESARKAAYEFDLLGVSLAGQVEPIAEKWPRINQHSKREALERHAQNCFSLAEFQPVGLAGELLGLAAQKTSARQLRRRIEDGTSNLFVFMRDSKRPSHDIDYDQIEKSLYAWEAELKAAVADCPDAEFPQFHALHAEATKILDDISTFGFRIGKTRTYPDTWDDAYQTLAGIRKRLLDLEDRAANLEVLVSDRLDAALAVHSSSFATSSQDIPKPHYLYAAGRTTKDLDFSVTDSLERRKEIS